MGQLTTQDNPQGHPPVLSRDRKRTREIFSCRKGGGSKVMCAQKAHISRRTLYNWLERAEAIRDARMDDPLVEVTPYDKDYLWFLAEWEEADFFHKQKHLTKIEDDADSGNVKSSQWLLTHLHPEEFGNRPDAIMQPRDNQQVIMLNIPAIKRRREDNIPVADVETVEDA